MVERRWCCGGMPSSAFTSALAVRHRMPPWAGLNSAHSLNRTTLWPAPALHRFQSVFF